MRSVNKVFLIGNLTSDPSVKYAPSGTAVATFGLATNYSIKDTNGGGYKDNVTYHNIVCYQKLAERAAQYLKKGNPVHIEGRLNTTSWEKDGHKNVRTEIVVTDLVMLGGKPSAPEQTQQVPINDSDIPF